MRCILSSSTLLFSAVLALADVVSYEAASFPEEEGWQRSTFCTPDRWIEDGRLNQHVEPAECFEPPSGDRDSYTRSIVEFDGQPTFFIEWRCQADGESSELTWGAPAVFVAGSLGPVDYWFAMARDEVWFTRDIDFAVFLVLDIEPDVPHTYRLEIHGDMLYVWYIDSQVVHSDVPGGAYPANTPSITWHVQSAFLESAVKLDYIRYGTIPVDASGDFDSDGDVDDGDLYFFQDCLLGPDADGPGCRWADMNGDGNADGADIRLFVDAMLAP